MRLSSKGDRRFETGLLVGLVFLLVLGLSPLNAQPMTDPVPGAVNVSTWVTIRWDAGPPDAHYEVLLLADVRNENALAIEDPEYDLGWVVYDDDDEFDGLNDELIVHQFDPEAEEGEPESLREFGPDHDDWERLIPNRLYRFRIAWLDEDGEFLRWEDDDPDGTPDNWDQFGWHFWTVDQVHAIEAVGDYRSVVIYYQNPYGNPSRDAWQQGTWTFEDAADDLEDINRNVHFPHVDTRVFGTEQIAATYGGLRNTHDLRADCLPQPDLVPEITEFEGWYQVAGAAHPELSDTMHEDLEFTYAQQERYREYVARTIRTFLLDCADRVLENGFADARNLEWVTLVGDAELVAPSFIYYYQLERVGPPDHRWLSTDFFYASQDGTPAVSTSPHYQISRIPMRHIGEAEGWLAKLEAFAQATDDEFAREAAYRDWFGRAVIVAGTEPAQYWYQWFVGLGRHMLGDEVFLAGRMVNVFSGLKTRMYSLFGQEDTPEEFTLDNVLRHMSDPEADYAPGFVYLLSRGFNEDPWNLDSQLAGGVSPLGPPGSLVSDHFDLEFDPETGVDHERRPVLVSVGGLLSRSDNSIWGREQRSIGEAAMLAPGGPLGVLGFSSAEYQVTEWYEPEYPDGTSDLMGWRDIPGTGTDNREGHTFPAINQGVLSLQRTGEAAGEEPVQGKAEIVKLIAQAYQSSTDPALGHLFNRALDEYVTRYGDALNDPGHDHHQRVATTVFGATMLGHASLRLPQREREPEDYHLDLTVTNPREPDDEGYPYEELTSYNSLDMPVHVIPHYTPPNNPGAEVSLRIQTGAPEVRVRVMTPFVQNEAAGAWHDTSGDHWVRTDPGGESQEVFSPDGGTFTYNFTAMRPSIYKIVVQARNPRWGPGDAEEYKWLRERWVYVQVVNEFVKQPDNNTLVIDVDQHDRYHLNGHWPQYWDWENYYVNPEMDGRGYDYGQNPRELPDRPALPIINAEADPQNQFPYHYWDSQPWYVGARDPDLQQWYGDLVPSGLQPFTEPGHFVVVFAGDATTLPCGAVVDGPRRFLFPYKSLSWQDVQYLRGYLDRGGMLFHTNQNFSDEAGFVVENDEDPPDEDEEEPIENFISYIGEFQEQYLGAMYVFGNTDYVNLLGEFAGTMSESIHDVQIADGDGANNSLRRGEVDLVGLEAETVFIWDTAAGPGIPETGEPIAAVENTIPATGARTVHFLWPFEAIDHAGTTRPDSSGRVNVMYRALRSLLFATAVGPTPPDGAVHVAREDLRLRWSGTADEYRVFFEDMREPVATTTATSHRIRRLDYDTTYRWRVDSVYHDHDVVMRGPEWTFTTEREGMRTSAPGNGGGCFLATAAHEVLGGSGGDVLVSNLTGTYALPAERARELDMVRALRDGLLLRARPGRVFTAWYYALGPYAAEAVRHREPAKAAVRRALLDPLARLSAESLAEPEEE